MKKRKENGSDLNKKPHKKPKKKIHRPKVVGEGKPKRTPKPKTPKCATPGSASLKPRTPKPATTKRVNSKKNKAGKGKNKSSLEDSITVSEEVSVERNDPIVSCRRRLNFDKDNPSEDPRTSIGVLSNGPLEHESSTQVANKDVNMSSGDFAMNQTGCQYNSIQRHQINRSSECLDTVIEVWRIPSTCQKRRNMGRKPDKGMRPPTTTVSYSLNDEPNKAKGKRSKQLRIARPREALACKRQESESFQRTEAKNDALFMGGNEGTMPGQNLQLYCKLSGNSVLE